MIDLIEGAERDWVFARRFVVRRMIERGDPSAADRIPDIPDLGALQDEVEQLRAQVDRYDAFFDAAFPDDPYLKGCLDGEWDAFARREQRALSEHPHGKTTHAHAHAHVPHSHMLRAICQRPECESYATHDIHRGPEGGGE